jgi:hypothetical protein
LYKNKPEKGFLKYRFEIDLLEKWILWGTLNHYARGTKEITKHSIRAPQQDSFKNLVIKT